MNSTMVTVTGTAVTGVRYALTVTGVPVAHFRLAAHERRFDRQRQAWVEGEPSYFTVWAWKWLAENILGSILRGDPVLVAGRMRVREWEVGEGKRRGVAAEIEATSIGHDLSRGTTVFRRTVKGQTPRRPLHRARLGQVGGGEVRGITRPGELAGVGTPVEPEPQQPEEVLEFRDGEEGRPRGRDELPGSGRCGAAAMAPVGVPSEAPSEVPSEVPSRVRVRSPSPGEVRADIRLMPTAHDTSSRAAAPAARGRALRQTADAG